MWHVSLAVRAERGGIRAAEKVSGGFQKAIRARLLDELRGVGEGVTIYERGEYAYHMRRKVSNDEFLRLPEAWRCIRPIDLGGTFTLIERIGA